VLALGDLHVRLVSDGWFRLDGGAMFGVVPKTVWNRDRPCDDRNRIQMATNCLLVTGPAGVVLVDTGLGGHLDPRFADQHGIDLHRTTLLDSLATLGLEPGDIDHVILTHLHFDHCGWNCRDTDSGPVPTFPRARYWLQRDEVEAARHPGERERSSYLPRNWEPLFVAGQVELFDESAEPVAGVRAVRAPGHTTGMAIVLVEGSGGGVAYLADLVPMASHVPTPWVMAYDLYPVTTMESKTSWLPRLAEEGRLCLFEHDPLTPAGRLVETRPGRYRAEPVPFEVVGAPTS
jgi:glyoxylase-like metal-dependent hydrolase (beta-lactamase superfamily II)